MTIDTLTYSNTSQGWTSRWSYRPEWMIGLNNSFYTFYEGDLYLHDSNTQRTLFYGVQGGFKISTVINQSPTEIKMFKTLALDSTHALEAKGSTDLDQIYMSSSSFVNKEGEWYSYMRRLDNQFNYDLISAQGVGNVFSTTAPNFIYMQDSFTNISKGDTICKAIFSGSEIASVVFVGTVDYVTQSTNEIKVGSIATPLSPGDYLVSFKSSSAESYGARGYFMNLELDGNTTEEVELFAVSVSAFKSFP
jgi:hypothetical protein